MLSRGHIIGKIVDDLAILKSQIETRNKLGQFDLTKYCEDFFREILNITYKLNLQNLNSSRSNYPGIDLGDKKKRIAYQITSEKQSSKINDTLSSLNEDFFKSYDIIYIFIIGVRQTSYTIDKKLVKKCSFKWIENIIDINGILKQIIVQDIQELKMLFDLFKSDFRQVRIELEPTDENGNFASSYFNHIESKPSSPAKNGILYLGKSTEKGYKQSLFELNEVYNQLALVPRVTREILAIIVDRGKFYSYTYRIIPEVIEKLLGISKKDMLIEIHILQNEGLVYLDQDEIDGRNLYFLTISGNINFLFYWLNEQNISIRTLLNTMDFTVLDE